MALARTTGAVGGWHNDFDVGHTRQPGIICLGSGVLLDAAVGRYRGKGGDEQSLLRSMLDTLKRGDILLGDAYYATYFLLCDLQHRGVDGVFEQYGARRKPLKLP